MQTLQGYQAALEGAVYYQIPVSGYLRVGGSDRMDFLQRQTSNDVRALTPDRAIMSVLTSPTARILDLFWFVEDADAIGVVTLPGRAAATEHFLRSRIFFNDDVTLENASANWGQIILDGPGVPVVLNSLGMPLPEMGEVSQIEFQVAAGKLIGQAGFSQTTVRILYPQEHLDAFEQSLSDAGAQALDDDAFHILRVENGLPGEAGELTDNYTPLEVGLQEAAISMDKGCYTGQEIIARQVNFDKITRHLSGLRVSAPGNVDDPVLFDGKSRGAITSFAVSPRFGNIALAVLKRASVESGTSVTIGETTGVVTALPFS